MQRAYAHAIAAGLSLLFLRRRLPAVSAVEPHELTPFSFRLIATDGAARRGEIATPHGAVQTPAFMPVGTQATVKGADARGGARDRRRHRARQHLSPDAAARRRADRRARRPAHIHELAAADPHRFRRLPGDVAVASCASSTSKGVTFRSHIDGAMVELSPERAIEIQTLLGSDIVMQLDECIKLPSTRGRDRARDAAVAALGRALQARLRGRAARPRAVRHRAGRRRCRRCASQSARALVEIGFHGYAIGGLAVGEPQEVMLQDRSRRRRRSCRPTGRAISWASARRTT